MRKIKFTLLFVLLQIATILGINAEIIKGDCGYLGDNVTYTFDTETGVLDFFGEGKMKDFSYPDYGPWYKNRDKIKIINISNKITNIGNYAFYGCSGLTSINIPNSVTSIEMYAFKDCSGLTSINIPNSVTKIGYGAFRGCSGLTSINIPNSVTTINKAAFQDCSGLTSINIPNSVTKIGYGAFWGCI